MAPDCAITSGTRKPPPISTSSPRETITSRPAASAASDSSVAAALLLTTTAASAPVRRQSSRSAWTSRRPRVPCVEVVFEVGVAAASGRDALDRRARERRAAEIGVEDDAGGVDDGAQATGRPSRRRRRGHGARCDCRRRPRRGLAAGDDASRSVGRRRAQRVDDGRRGRNAASSARIAGALPELFDRRDDAKSDMRISAGDSFGRVQRSRHVPDRSCAPRDPQIRLPPVDADVPQTTARSSVSGRTSSCRSSRPTRSWRALNPELAEALFGTPPLPFSISMEFPTFDGPDYARALEMARASAEYREIGAGDRRAPPRAVLSRATRVRLRDLFEIVGRFDATEVLIDDRPVPYARELWLPLRLVPDSGERLPTLGSWPN